MARLPLPFFTIKKRLATAKDRCQGQCRPWWALPLLVFAAKAPSQAQRPVDVAFINAYQTSTLRHSQKFDQIADLRKGHYVDVGWYAQCKRGEAPNDPFQFGAHLLYYDTRSTQLGSGLGFGGDVCFPIFNQGRFSSNFNLGFGGIFMGKHYDPATNPDNRIIGTTLNAMATARFQAAFRLTDRLALALNGGVFHISNGSFKLPNSGINALQYGLGLQYVAANTCQLHQCTATRPKRPACQRTAFWSVKMGTAVFQKVGGFNERHFVLGNVGLYRHLELANIFVLAGGLNAEHSDYFRAMQEKHPDSVSSCGPRLGLELLGELFMEHVSVRGGAGYYLFNPLKQVEDRKFYLRLSAQYYFKDTRQGYLNRAYVGIGLKAHRHVAQYPELLGGYLFALRKKG